MVFPIFEKEDSFSRFARAPQACAAPIGGSGFAAELGAAVCAGQLVGCAVLGAQADAHGRRRTFVCSGVFDPL